MMKNNFLVAMILSIFSILFVFIVVGCSDDAVIDHSHDNTAPASGADSKSDGFNDDILPTDSGDPSMQDEESDESLFLQYFYAHFEYGYVKAFSHCTCDRDRRFGSYSEYDSFEECMEEKSPVDEQSDQLDESDCVDTVVATMDSEPGEYAFEILTCKIEVLNLVNECRLEVYSVYSGDTCMEESEKWLDDCEDMLYSSLVNCYLFPEEGDSEYSDEEEEKFMLFEDANFWVDDFSGQLAYMCDMPRY